MLDIILRTWFEMEHILQAQLIINCQPEAQLVEVVRAISRFDKLYSFDEIKRPEEVLLGVNNGLLFESFKEHNGGNFGHLFLLVAVAVSLSEHGLDLLLNFEDLGVVVQHE